MCRCWWYIYDFAKDLINEIRNTDWENPITDVRKTEEIFKTLYKFKLQCMGYGADVDRTAGLTAERAERWLAMWQPIKNYFNNEFKIADDEQFNDVMARMKDALENKIGLNLKTVYLEQYRVSHPFIQFFIEDELGYSMTFDFRSNGYTLNESIECYVTGDDDTYPTDEQELLDILYKQS